MDLRAANNSTAIGNREQTLKKPSALKQNKILKVFVKFVIAIICKSDSSLNESQMKINNDKFLFDLIN